jgi:CheY-like chemotaxis protein
VLIDGQTTVTEIVKRARKITPDELRTALEELLRKGLIGVDADSTPSTIDPGDFFTLKPAQNDTNEAAKQAPAKADADTEFLRKNGYYVNIARKPAATRHRTEGVRLKVLIIEDDPDICKLLQMFLRLEDFDSGTAGNREEIIAEFRRAPLPDLVLLDVKLTDANGFDVLARIRQHPLLKELPVIMLTADATRGAVLKGILGGANGFVTKPFEILPLVKAVKTVLGLKYGTKVADWDNSRG